MPLTRAIDLKSDVDRRSVVLFGPRRTGKSHLIQSTLGADRTYDLLHADVFARLSRRPSLIREELQPSDRLIVVDEVQKLPSLMDEIHSLIESTNVRFVLAGSSARKLRRSHTGLMAGRARQRRLFPFISRELGPFDLQRALNTGLLPPIWLSDEPWQDLGDYVGEYLTEEIRAEALARNIEAFSRFLQTAALANSLQLNFESIASDAGVPARTVREYFALLEDTLVGYTLEPLDMPPRKAVSHAKFYFFDNGVVNRLIGRREVVEGTDDFGRAFETFLCHELLAWRAYRQEDDPVRFWRTHNGDEVDFVIGDHTAVEVKATTFATEKHLKGLSRLGGHLTLRRKILVSRDPTRRRIGDVDVWPWFQFLQALWADAL
ncbi:MAG: ATP-binding protein [Myxococcales bacterium]|nr:ATP-binding protein [Myxococcales bacterium]